MSIAKDSPTESMTKIQRFWLNTKRIIKISTKPTRQQYFMMIKVSAIGILIIGGLHYIVQLIANLLSGAGGASGSG